MNAHTHTQSQQGSVDCAVVDYIACTVRVYVCTSNILFTGQCQS